MTATRVELAQPVFTTALDPSSFDVGDGPLAGLRVAVKDNIDVEGVPTTAACPSRTEPAAAHATVVRRLLAAGARLVGKTNMDQFATGLVGTRSPFGACHSVYSAEHVSGGSSSGSAVAVAGGLADVALGTDTAGSGRVPAAFNGIVGVKPTRGLLPTTGVLPACPSLDCVSVFARDVVTARTAVEALLGPDAADPYSRVMPVTLPTGVARRMQVIAVPDAPLDLDDLHRDAWTRAVDHARTLGHVVPVDVRPLLEAAQLLYGGAFVAERLEAFGHLLADDDPEVDPVVRSIVFSARSLPATQVYADLRRLAQLAARSARVFVGADAVLLPVTPTHPTLTEVAADPVGVNARLGTFTNMVNLLDLCAVAVPAAPRADGLPFGVQLLAPAFADRPLLDLAARWTGEQVPAVAHRFLLAVAGAHLTGQPRNVDLVAAGGVLHARTRTAGGYRMHLVPGPFPRPGLVRADGPPGGIEVELWDLPADGLGRVLPTVAQPLSLGQVELADTTVVTGFVADPTAVGEDISCYGGWRAYLAAQSSRT